MISLARWGRTFGLTLFTLTCPMNVARANDGGIAFGGSPKLLRSHPSVSMESEVVRITVGEEIVTVDCRFVFRNRGPAATVRMGFPDEGTGGDAVEDEGIDEQGRPVWKNAPPKSAFRSFRSWVDGKPVKTQLIRADAPNRFWHAKTVRFPANSTHVVRDVYTVNVGGQVTMHNQYVHQTSYVLHTGASWRGRIGRSEVLVTFQRKLPAMPLRPIPVSAVPGRDPSRLNWSKIPSGTVYYAGPSAPVPHRNTLRFVRRNWEPTLKDDVWLVFKSPVGN